MSRKNLLALVSAASLATGCASGGPEPTPPPVLGFGQHATASALYHVADSTRMSLPTPMGDMTMQDVSRATLDLAFAEDAAGTRVTATVTAFEAKTESSMTGVQTADAGDVEGALVFVMDGRGAVDVVSVPETSGLAGDRARFTAVAHGLFPRLPDRAFEPGLSWTDTVAWSSEGDESVQVTTAYRYSLTGDTIVDGRRLAVISVSGDSGITIDADMGGMATVTTLEGSEAGSALWDLERGLLHSLALDQEFEGSVQLEMVGVPDLPVEIHTQWRVRLADEGRSP